MQLISTSLNIKWALENWVFDQSQKNSVNGKQISTK